jgi:thiopurine S-methyltransferase
MEHTFWHDKWAKNEIGFHLSQAHPWLVGHLEQYPLAEYETVFVPLCGKTLDIGLLLSKGARVIANELSEKAVEELFDQLGYTAEVSDWKGTGKIYRAESLTVFVGDFFELEKEELVDVTTVYDRAAIVALPKEMRDEYAKKIIQLCGNTKQIIMTLDYDQDIMAGPPFSVPFSEVSEHYAEHFNITEVYRRDIVDLEPRFKAKGLPEFNQTLYVLEPR